MLEPQSASAAQPDHQQQQCAQEPAHDLHQASALLHDANQACGFDSCNAPLSGPTDKHTALVSGAGHDALAMAELTKVQITWLEANAACQCRSNSATLHMYNSLSSVSLASCHNARLVSYRGRADCGRACISALLAWYR